MILQVTVNTNWENLVYTIGDLYYNHFLYSPWYSINIDEEIHEKFNIGEIFKEIIKDNVASHDALSVTIYKKEKVSLVIHDDIKVINSVSAINLDSHMLSQFRWPEELMGVTLVKNWATKNISEIQNSDIFFLVYHYITDDKLYLEVKEYPLSFV